MKVSRCIGNPESPDERGFTLIELLVVILIIGILAAIAVPTFLNQRKVAADAALKSDMRSMALAVETWQVQNSKLAGDMYIDPSHVGWTAVKHGANRNSRTSSTIGALNRGPDGFDSPQLSEGNSIGVMTNPTQQPNGEKGYCLLGFNAGGSYQPHTLASTPEGVSLWSHGLYYDSTSGGFYEAEDIPHGGACTTYRNRVSS